MSMIGYFFYLPVLAIIQTIGFIGWFLQNYWWTLIIAYLFFIGAKLRG